MGKVISVKMELSNDSKILEELQNRHTKYIAKYLVNNFSYKEIDIILKKLEKI